MPVLTWPTGIIFSHCNIDKSSCHKKGGYPPPCHVIDMKTFFMTVQVERSSEGFHIDLDDFLTGLLLLANELVSFTSQYNKRKKLANRNVKCSVCSCYHNGKGNVIK